jgi:hypothetical protein
MSSPADERRDPLARILLAGPHRARHACGPAGRTARLGVIEQGSVVNDLFVLVPPACWIAAVLWKRPARPFATVVVIGVIYGVFLAIGHQLLWDTVLGGTAPALGGNLATIDPATQEGGIRTAAVVSSLVTGSLVGVVAGAVALVLCRMVPAGPAEHRTGSGHHTGDGKPRA